MHRLQRHAYAYWRVYVAVVLGVCITVVGLQVIAFATAAAEPDRALGIDVDRSHRVISRVTKTKQDQEWELVMRRARISSVELFDRGLADKYQMLLEPLQEEDLLSHHTRMRIGSELGDTKEEQASVEEKRGKEMDIFRDVQHKVPERYQGTNSLYLVSVKHMERESVSWLEWPTKAPALPGFEEERDSRRADRVIQGWSEVVAYHVDRLMGFNRKPPTVGRRIPRALLHEAVDRNGYEMSLQTWLVRMFAPEYVDVALQSWVSHLHTTPPDDNVFKFLATPSFQHMIKGSLDKFFAGDVSDVILFDYLLDDHDRHRSHNWISDGSGRLLNWDNGLAFNHGPIGKQRCLDLFCGTDTWKEWDRKHGHKDKRHCTRICRFRNSTVTTLKSLENLGERGEWTMSYKLDQRLREDDLFPVVNHGIYYEGSNRYPKVRYEYREFLVGMDRKVSRALAHIDLCIQKYGEEWVRSEEMG
eukprot:TRINITY_DN5498_c0_g1_i2.p1 TRINITY_DN5498_c0_g1~~TRINITY_DN5498_c0_g1_i2.p1  ORF type:complete len:473 (+),score=69.22 TRINITY_DN5498_c0_g1_i2:218-1636(+)